jgi:hypothetical protein
MKLRSGKILNYNSLPPILEEKLNSSLEKFKELLTNNEECVKELIKIIAEAIILRQHIEYQI